MVFDHSEKHVGPIHLIISSTGLPVDLILEVNQFIFFSSSLCEQRSLLSWSIARRGVCAHITCRKLVLKSASCNLKRKQEVTAKQKFVHREQR